MIKFKELTRLKIMISIIVFIKYALWCTFFILQGKAIELALKKNNLYKELIYILAGYIFVKLLVMFCDIIQKFSVEYYKNIELKYQWSNHLPKAVYSDNQNNKNDIHVLFFDYLPKMFECKTSLVLNKVTLSCIVAVTITTFVYSKFYLGLFALSLVFILNYLSKNIFIKKIDYYQKENYQNKITLLNWIDQYFSAFREISKNWQGIANASWKEVMYYPYFISKKKQITFHLYRDLLAQILVELPFLLNTAFVIVSVYFDYLSLTQLFIWVGLSQFMINASNAYLENKITRKQLTTLVEQVAGILKTFQAQDKKLIENIIDDGLSFDLTMQDGEMNSLSLKPGLYHIKGGNGSGKSTLMNTILGYERRSFDFKNPDVSLFLNSIATHHLRVIDRETIVFDCLSDFNSQIGGPDSPSKEWKLPITASLNQLLTADLAQEWMKVFLALEATYMNRKDKTLSSGEKVVLSLMRFFYAWDRQVKLLIIDECDSFLDSKKKQLFAKAISELSLYMAVYVSCHNISLEKSFYLLYDKKTPLHFKERNETYV